MYEIMAVERRNAGGAALSALSFGKNMKKFIAKGVCIQRLALL